MAETKFLKTTCSHCGGRIEFPADGLGMTVPCPHCDWKTELSLETPESETPARSVKWSVAGLTILLVGVLAVAGAFLATRHLLNKSRARAERAAAQAARVRTTNVLSSANPAPRPSAQITNLPNGFVASAVKIEKTSGSSLIYAAGTLKNDTDQQRFGVTVEIELLDAAGNVAGKTRDYKDVIEPRREWTFRAPVLKKDVTAARIASVQEQP